MRKDTTKLFKKVFACVLHIRSVDEKLLLKNKKSLKSSLAQETSFEDSDIYEEYDTIKVIEERLITYASHIRKFTPKNGDRELETLNDAITSAVMTIKYMKDVIVNISYLRITTSSWGYKQYQQFREMLTRLYKIISEVIDETYDDDVLSKMLGLVADIKKVDQQFMDSLTQIVEKDTVKKYDLSDVLHVNRYVYLSAMSFVEAIKYLYMKSTEKKVFEQLK